MTTITATPIRAFRVVGANGSPETFLHDSDWMGMSAYDHPTLGTLIVTPASGPAAQAFAEILGSSSTMNVVSGSPNALEFIGASPSAVQPPQSLIDELERLSHDLVHARTDALEEARQAVRERLFRMPMDHRTSNDMIDAWIDDAIRSIRR